MNISQRLSLVAVTLVLGSAALLSQEQNETLLQIDDQIISSADVEKKAHQLLTANPELDPEQLTTISLKDLVHAALFRRAAQQLQIPLAIFEQFINDHIAREVERAGSYHEFLEDQKLKLGIENMDDYKLYVLNDFIRAEVLNILLGKNPTTNKGFLAIIEPTPAEVRQAFKENEAYRTIPATSSWSFLKFSRTIGSDSAQQRAEDAVAAFNAKEISYSELIKQADLEIQRQGYTQDSAPWVIEFVSNAKSGDV
ncbi:MAG: hypothetical protein QGF46_04680, partial [Planctomycetota bacterium]|nr:hypothetical protein [Planctomycetota bacterium]